MSEFTDKSARELVELARRIWVDTGHADAAFLHRALDEKSRLAQAHAQLSLARVVTVDPQILIDARIELAAFYDLVSPYRGDRMPVKMYGIPEGFARVGVMLRRLDAVIADLPKE